MGVPTSEVGYTIVTTRRETTKVHNNMWWHRGGGEKKIIMSLNYSKCISNSLKIYGWYTLKWCLNWAINSLYEPAIFVHVKNAPVGHPEVSSVFQNKVFWVLMSCSPAGGYKHEWTCCYYLKVNLLLQTQRLTISIVNILTTQNFRLLTRIFSCVELQLTSDTQ